MKALLAFVAAGISEYAKLTNSVPAYESSDSLDKAFSVRDKEDCPGARLSADTVRRAQGGQVLSANHTIPLIPIFSINLV